jgi:hypothetical protein
VIQRVERQIGAFARRVGSNPAAPAIALSHEDGVWCWMDRMKPATPLRFALLLQSAVNVDKL